jgi:hypothetical protein
VPRIKETVGKINWALNPSKRKEISSKFLQVRINLRTHHGRLRNR